MSTRHVTIGQLVTILTGISDRSESMGRAYAGQAQEEWHNAINDPKRPTMWADLSPKWIEKKARLIDTNRVTRDPSLSGPEHKGLFTGALRDSAEVHAQQNIATDGHTVVMRLGNSRTSYEGRPIWDVYEALYTQKGPIISDFEFTALFDATIGVIRDGINTLIDVNST